MEITWLGHAAFRIRAGGSALLMDPFPPELGLRIPPAQGKADVVSESSSERFHSAADAATGGRVVIDAPGEYEAAGMRFRGIRTTRRTPEGEPQRWNTIFVGEAEGITFCHLGNPDRLLTNHEINDLGAPHILMVPAGSDTGISAADAVEIVNSVEPKIVVPMLYAHSGNRSLLRVLDHFLHELGGAAPSTQARLSVTRSNLPDETQLVVLEPAGTLL